MLECNHTGFESSKPIVWPILLCLFTVLIKGFNASKSSYSIVLWGSGTPAYWSKDSDLFPFFPVYIHWHCFLLGLCFYVFFFIFLFLSKEAFIELSINWNSKLLTSIPPNPHPTLRHHETGLTHQSIDLEQIWSGFFSWHAVGVRIFSISSSHLSWKYDGYFWLWHIQQLSLHCLSSLTLAW